MLVVLLFFPIALADTLLLSPDTYPARSRARVLPDWLLEIGKCPHME